MVPEVYDALFFPSYLSFPLEGKSREAGKGVRGRAPIGCSIAVLTANRRPPERSDAKRTANPVGCFLPALIDEWRRIVKVPPFSPRKKDREKM